MLNSNRTREGENARVRVWMLLTAGTGVFRLVSLEEQSGATWRRMKEIIEESEIG